MILARLCIYGAILCTLYFNGSIAHSKGVGLTHQWAMVALAITIDVAKCSFLPAASAIWNRGHPFRASLLFILFFPCFAFSTFAGYSYILQNRSGASAETQTKAQARLRAQKTYDQASADLATAKTHRYWKQSGGCASPRNRRHRKFCSNLKPTQQRLAKTETLLEQRAVVYADPEIQTLATTFGLEMTTLELIAAALPALILELVAGLGLYALNITRTIKPSERASKSRFTHLLHRPQNTPKTQPVANSRSSTVTQTPSVNSHVQPRIENLNWDETSAV